MSTPGSIDPQRVPDEAFNRGEPIVVATLRP
jgi:hypothetical protein